MYNSDSSVTHEVLLSSLTCITSNTRSLNLSADPIRLVSGVGQAGSVVVCKVVTIGAYGAVEDRTGHDVRLRPGDLIVGVLGDRHSTTSMFGGLPEAGIEVPTAEPIDLLAIGGVIGICQSWPSYLGSPTKLHVLGLASQGGEQLNTRSQLCTSTQLTLPCPLVLVAGTAAEVGKTTFASNLIHFFSRHLGRRVAATKLAGTGRLRDLLNLRDAGAQLALDFVDGGLATTYAVPDDLVVSVTKGVLKRLGEAQPEVIVAEIGGDILGAHVPAILADPEIRAATRVMVLVPSDGLAAYGALSLLAETGFPSPIYIGQPIRNPAASRWRSQTLLKRPMLDSTKEEDLTLLVSETFDRADKSS